MGRILSITGQIHKNLNICDDGIPLVKEANARFECLKLNISSGSR